jgi:mono/diheme cytochrome c family protein
MILFVLPFLDTSNLRHFLDRPVITGGTVIVITGIGLLSTASILEAPPPLAKFGGDEVANLYIENCAGCHGSTINVPLGTNLHEEIAQGKHEGMPTWSADLSTDQIDALAGFILSPAGSILFFNNCGSCHEAHELVSSDPFAMKQALSLGSNFEPHMDLVVPNWAETLSQEAQTSLLNFLIAPDGQRLFAINCSTCHGRSIAFSGDEGELRETIHSGGLHLEMPAWQDKLSEPELRALTHYIIGDNGSPEGLDLYVNNCMNCHGNRLPRGEDFDETYQEIATGGSHQTMPIWGDILTDEQLDALVSYTVGAAEGTPTALGQYLWFENCVSCHGDFGEGGVNPARPDDVIAPISTSEYLKTRDDITLRAIISQGQPNFGMSPFGTAFGGPLEEDEIEALVVFIRSWEANPPVELPPEYEILVLSLSGAEIYSNICAQCHGLNADGGVGPSLRDPIFRSYNSNQAIFNSISQGHQVTNMIAWGEILTSTQIVELVEFIYSLPVTEGSSSVQGPSFAAAVIPIFQQYCDTCHDSETRDGGWDSSSYDLVMASGDNAPVVIPGDVDNSLLAQKILGIQEEGDMMPTLRALPFELTQIILDWISQGALNN